MNAISPSLLPKVRSKALRQACQHMPCSLRIASFVPGKSCSPQNTVVGCHLGNLGRGTSSKVSDLCIAAGCWSCHEIADGRDRAALDYILQRYPAAFMERLMLGVFETQHRWVALGLLTVPDGEVI